MKSDNSNISIEKIKTIINTSNYTSMFLLN